MTKQTAGNSRKDKPGAGNSARRTRNALPQPFKVKDSNGNFTGKWRNIVNVDGHPVSKNGTYEEVVKWTAATLGKRTGVKVVHQNITLLDLWAQCEADNTRRWARRTRDLNDEAHGWLEPLMSIQLRKLTGAEIDKLYDGLWAHGYADNTVSTVHKRLSFCLNWGEKKGIVVRNPIRQVTVPHVAAHEVEVFELADWNRFTDFVVDPGFALFFRLAYHTGARVGELHALKWTDIRGDQLSITKTMISPAGGDVLQNKTKTKKNRSITIAPAMLARLHDARAGRLDGFIFATKNGDGPWSMGWTRKYYKALQKKAGVSLGALGVIRHTAISQALRKYSVSMVAQRAGNTAAVIEKYYAGFIPRGDAGIAEDLEAATG